MSAIARNLQQKLLTALQVNPLIFLNGPRQAGKTTLVKYLAKQKFPAEYLTFDSATNAAAAANSPVNFLKARDSALIIDEVQLVPEIFRALKIVIDELREESTDKLTGKFLLTGSANILALPKLANPLVGRMGVLTLYPFSSQEINKGDNDFLQNLFAAKFTKISKTAPLIEMVRKATFPEISGADYNTRNIWFDGYLTTILQRDVRNLAEIEKLNSLPNLLRIIANRSGNLVNDADLARDAGLNAVTTRNYKTLLKMLFLTFEVKPWYRNITKRLVKAPKSYMIDSLLLCYLLEYELADLEQKRPELFGHVLENFVATELLKAISKSSENYQLCHFRTSDNKEIDFILEKPNGELSAIEVKASDNVSAADFKHLKLFKDLTNQDFRCGIVLYQGKEIVPFDHDLFAVPIACLWQ